jgi:glycerophosphoryl diester phosphodiesterase
MTRPRTIPPKIIAHRGGAAIAPENTLGAFRQALALGVDGVELDLQLSDDGELVVIHDVLPPGPAPKDAPRLDAVLELIFALNPDARIVVDLKATPWRADRRDQGRQLVDAAAALFGAYQRPERIVLASFDWGALEHAAESLPGLATAFHTIAVRSLDGLSPAQTGIDDRRDLLSYLEDWRQGRGKGIEALSPLDLMGGAGARIWSPQHRDVTQTAVEKAHSLGLQVWTWTVNAPSDLQRVLDLGVDAVTTDRPDKVLHYLETQTWDA